ncbi:type II toxin-antitoxin system HicB family antitoxin [Colwellia sp. M166]|uniref:type II toxin-antitoxin system HicB family antitoxin n=1 Tax=Colwellia sp. M166 TaxID=2583805 RepID=UPI00211EB82B|nr:type II toxin-antitoxin system HicB family antitoxin [Colwellia sp. M166]UUO25121.1 type II toxin-antitoxin system HicB family antitoxin [Colwellia sp. M166]|tara:strand:- start:16957 stop:17427 length:471 start_codon:yes stop_codon:yes gene_type:complete
MKSKLLEYKGYYASINVSVEDECVFGKVEFINDSIVFGADTVAELKVTFKSEIEDYLEFCKEVGKDPDKTMTGSFNIRIGEELHKKALVRAKLDSVTLNEVIKKSVEQYVNSATEIHNHVNVNVQNVDNKSVTTQPFELSPSTAWTASEEVSHGSH